LEGNGNFDPGALKQTFSFQAFEIIIGNYDVIKNVNTKDISGIE
jgi:hypothetical protein